MIQKYPCNRWAQCSVKCAKSNGLHPTDSGDDEPRNILWTLRLSGVMQRGHFKFKPESHVTSRRESHTYNLSIEYRYD